MAPLLAILLLVAGDVGCATGVPVKDPFIKVSDAAGVGSCHYLDSVVAPPVGMGCMQRSASKTPV